MRERHPKPKTVFSTGDRNAWRAVCGAFLFFRVRSVPCIFTVFLLNYYFSILFCVRLANFVTFEFVLAIESLKMKLNSSFFEKLLQINIDNHIDARPAPVEEFVYFRPM